MSLFNWTVFSNNLNFYYESVARNSIIFLLSELIPRTVCAQFFPKHPAGSPWSPHLSPMTKLILLHLYQKLPALNPVHRSFLQATHEPQPHFLLFLYVYHSILGLHSINTSPTVLSQQGLLFKLCTVNLKHKAWYLCRTALLRKSAHPFVVLMEHKE